MSLSSFPNEPQSFSSVSWGFMRCGCSGVQWQWLGPQEVDSVAAVSNLQCPTFKKPQHLKNREDKCFLAYRKLAGVWFDVHDMDATGYSTCNHEGAGVSPPSSSFVDDHPSTSTWKVWVASWQSLSRRTHAFIHEAPDRFWCRNQSFWILRQNSIEIQYFTNASPWRISFKERTDTKL